jgi:nucleotide-binding universal stress UspA family protein
MFRRILVPVDFSEKNDAAIEIAIEMGRRAGGEPPVEVTLLHVIETIEHMDFEEMAGFYRKLETRATAQLITLADRFTAAGVQVRFEVLVGRRAESILKQAIDQQSDLILLSSHRVDRDHPALGLGIISYQVAILAQCPVLLVK